MKANIEEVILKILEEGKSQNFSLPEGRQFLSDAFVALSALDFDYSQRILKGTRILDTFKSYESKVQSDLKERSFEFFWEIGTLQLIREGQIVNYPIKRYSAFVSDLGLDLSSIEGIISAGFLIQPEVFKVFQLAQVL